MRFIFLLMVVVSAFAAARGQQARYLMRSKPFTELQASGRVDVTCRVVPDSAGYVAFSATATGAECLRMANAGHALSITLDRGARPGDVGEVTVYLAEALSSVHARGAARVGVHSMGSPAGEAFIILNGNGAVTVGSLSAAQAMVSLNGGGRVSIAGTADIKLINLNCSGSGSITAQGLECDVVNANLQGSGKITIAGRARQASASASGSGTISASELNAATLKASSFASGRVLYGPGCRDVKRSGNLSNILPAQ